MLSQISLTTLSHEVFSLFTLFFSFSRKHKFCVCSFYALYHSLLDGGGTQGLSSECKTDQTDFTDWMYLSSNPWRKSASVQIFKAFHQHEIAEKGKIT